MFSISFPRLANPACLTFGAMLFAPLITARAADDVEKRENITLADIRAVWAEQHARSFRYEGTVVNRVRNIKFYGRTDSFPGSADGEESEHEIASLLSTMEKTFAYSFDRGKFAHREHGRQWDHELGRPAYVAFAFTFDGETGREFLSFDEKDYTSATIEFAAKTNDLRRVSESSFFNRVNQMGFRIAHFPEHLLEPETPPPPLHSRVSNGILQHSIEHDGHDCMEVVSVLSVSDPGPRSERDYETITRLYVDPARHFLPLKYIRSREGAFKTEISIRYAGSNETGWRVQSWTSKMFNGEGREKQEMKIKVSRALVNQPIDNDVFRFKFPADTYIRQLEGKRWKYFLAMEDGTLKGISQWDYHRSFNRKR